MLRRVIKVKNPEIISTEIKQLDMLCEWEPFRGKTIIVKFFRCGAAYQSIAQQRHACLQQSVLVKYLECAWDLVGFFAIIHSYVHTTLIVLSYSRSPLQNGKTKKVFVIKREIRMGALQPAKPIERIRVFVCHRFVHARRIILVNAILSSIQNWCLLWNIFKMDAIRRISLTTASIPIGRFIKHLE